MIEVEMSKDIRECEPKLLGPFNKRQLIVCIIAAAYGVPLYFLLNQFLPVLFLRIIIVILLMSPTIACGWLNFQGMHFEQFVIHIFKNFILSPSKRDGMKENSYEMIYNQMFPEIDTTNKKKRKRSKEHGMVD